MKADSAGIIECPSRVFIRLWVYTSDAPRRRLIRSFGLRRCLTTAFVFDNYITCWTICCSCIKFGKGTDYQLSKETRKAIPERIRSHMLHNAHSPLFSCRYARHISNKPATFCHRTASESPLDVIYQSSCQLYRRLIDQIYGHWTAAVILSKLQSRAPKLYDSQNKS